MRKQSFRKAIALEYGSRAAPVITVNESGANAEAIIAEDAQLVELLGQLELNEEIPDNLYTAVAVILSWVYWLKGIQPTDQNN